MDWNLGASRVSISGNTWILPQAQAEEGRGYRSIHPLTVSEVLLNAAEAAFELGDPATAAALI